MRASREPKVEVFRPITVMLENGDDYAVLCYALEKYIANPTVMQMWKNKASEALAILRSVATQ